MFFKKLSLRHRPTSLKIKITINYISQIYTIGIALVMSPVYLAMMGTEAYGLVSFFTMMSAWFLFLDMGLTPMFSREVARFRGGAIGPDELCSLLRILEIAFVSVAIIAGLAVVIMSHSIATHWLSAEVLSPQQVTSSVLLMGLTVPLQWISGLYRGICNGFEKQVWLACLTVIISTLRFVGILVIFDTVGTMPAVFFSYQLCIAALELALLFMLSYYFLPRNVPAVLSFALLKANLNFTLMIAFSATGWILITQFDKLLLSKFLTLSEYGVFSIGAVSASVIISLTGPMAGALQPKLTRLTAAGDKTGVTALYTKATQLMCVIVAPPVAILAFFPEQVLNLWTHNQVVAHHAAPILSLYAIGNGLLAIGAFPYYLQSAKGDLRFVVLNNILLIIFSVPAIILAVASYGGIGAGAVWVASNFLCLVFWVPIVHKRFFDGSHMNWMLQDICAIIIPVALVAWVSSIVIPMPSEEFQVLGIIIGLSCLFLIVATTASSDARKLIRQYLQQLIQVRT
jgi:O-antigen/teichoic acid export membrane protein